MAYSYFGKMSRIIENLMLRMLNFKAGIAIRGWKI